MTTAASQLNFRVDGSQLASHIIDIKHPLALYTFADLNTLANPNF
jgi:hypothetical protein